MRRSRGCAAWTAVSSSTLLLVRRWLAALYSSSRRLPPPTCSARVSVGGVVLKLSSWDRGWLSPHRFIRPESRRRGASVAGCAVHSSCRAGPGPRAMWRGGLLVRIHCTCMAPQHAAVQALLPGLPSARAAQGPPWKAQGRCPQQLQPLRRRTAPLQGRQAGYSCRLGCSADGSTARRDTTHQHGRLKAPGLPGDRACPHARALPLRRRVPIPSPHMLPLARGATPTAEEARECEDGRVKVQDPQPRCVQIHGHEVLGQLGLGRKDRPKKANRRLSRAECAARHLGIRPRRASHRQQGVRARQGLTAQQAGHRPCSTPCSTLTPG